MTSSKSGMNIVVDTRSLSRLSRDLRRGAPEAWKAYRTSVRGVAEVVLKDAKERAVAPSRPGLKGHYTAGGFRYSGETIADSLKVRVLTSGNVKIVGGGEAAPGAAPVENKGKGFVRHPVFGNRENWTAKNSRPAYLSPALDAHREEVMKAIEDAVVAAVERAVKGR